MSGLLLFLLQLLRSCVDSRLICTSTAVTLMLHGCGGSFRPCYAHHVTEFPAFNLILLAPVTGPFVDALDRPFAVNGRDAPTLWGVSVGIFSFNLFYVLAQCVSDFTVDSKSKWSMCDVTTCTGDKRDEEQILCVTCRRWFHKICLPGEVGDQPLGTYFKCTTSLSARNQS